MIIRTKLHRPQIPGNFIQRPHLLTLLEENPRRAFTLVSAPAGYGKSSLISGWLEGAGEPVAWLSLDEGERELGAFLKYIVAAVRTHSPKACRRTHDLLSVAELPSASVLADSLCNDLDLIKRRFALVLDDFHYVDASEISQFVDTLLRHPPRSLHLVVITRRDPAFSLARMRATGGMVEIRENDLRFSRNETWSLIERVAGVTISEESLTHLHTEVEGWIVGLRLVCLALRDRDDPDAYLEKLRGGVNTIQDYLTEEVLSKQIPEFRHCLLEASILKRFCAPLCDAVFGSSSEEAAGEEGDESAMMGGEEFLRRLVEANLFSIGLDPQGDWFRFHHQFGVLLQQHLERHADAGRIAALHLRASAWFEESGMVGEAIEHALAAGDVELATRIIKRCRRAELEEDRWLGIEKWLELLPEDLRNQHRELLMAQAWVASFRLQLARIPVLVSQAELLMGDAGEPDPFLLAELNHFRAVVYYWEGRGEECKRCSEQAHEFFGEKRGLIGGEVRTYLAFAYNLCGKGAAAIEAIEQDFQMSDAADFAFSTRMISAKAFLHLFAGDLDPAARLSKQLITIAERWPSRYAEAWGRYLLALARLHAYELDDAADSFRGVVQYRDYFERRCAIDGCCGLLLSYQLMGRSGEATAVADDFATFVSNLTDPECQQVEASCRARLALLQGDLKTAVGWARSVEMKPQDVGMAFWLEQPAVTLARVLIAEGSKLRLLKASELLAQLRSQAEARHLTCQLIDIVVLQAVVFERQKKGAEALNVLTEAVTIARPGGWIRPFVEVSPYLAAPLEQLAKTEANAFFVGQILDARDKGDRTGEPSDGKRQTVKQPLIEPLTNRELDVLELLAKRMYDKEIAEMLSVSVATVKTHLKHIYGKLCVSGRRQAVVRAEELGILKS